MLWQNRLFGEHSFHKLQLQLATTCTFPKLLRCKFSDAITNLCILSVTKVGTIRKSLEKISFFSFPFHSTVRTITQLLCLSFYFTCILDSETQSLRTTSLWWSTFGKDCILGCMSTPKISDCRFWPWTALLPHLRTEVRSPDTLL